jgi:hypothetical protein
MGRSSPAARGRRGRRGSAEALRESSGGLGFVLPVSCARTRSCSSSGTATTEPGTTTATRLGRAVAHGDDEGEAGLRDAEG